MSCFSLRLGRCTGLAALALTTAVTLAHAQATPSAPTRPDPLDAKARVPAATYQSPLARYRPLGEDKQVPWTQANETVNRIGGWRAYAREAQQPDSPASAPAKPGAATPAATPAAATGGHGSHGSHSGHGGHSGHKKQ